MHIIGRAKALLASLRDDNRGVMSTIDEVGDDLRDIAPKVEAEFKALEESGVLGRPHVTIGPDGLPVPDSLYADYQRARAELEKWLGAQAQPSDPKHAAPSAPAEAPATPVAS